MAETKKYYHNIDADNNKIINPLLNPLTTAQRTAVGTLLGPLDEGYVCFDTTLNQQYFWDGTAWVTVTASAAWGSITGTLTAQTDLTAYLAANYYPLLTNPAGYLTLGTLPPIVTPNLQQVTNQGFTTTNSITSSNASGQIILDNTGTYSPFPNISIFDTVNSTSAIFQTSLISLQDIGNPLLTASYYTNEISIGNPSGSFVLTYPSQSGTFALTSDLSGYVTAVTATSPLASSGGTTPDISIQQANGSQAGYLSSADWTTFNSKQDIITLTTTGTSGPATFISNTLNIPQYQSVLTNPVTGTGTATRVAFWDSSSSISSDSGLYWDNTNKRLGIGTTTPSYKVDVNGDENISGKLNFTHSSNATQIRIGANGNGVGGASTQGDFVIIGRYAGTNLLSTAGASLVAIGYNAGGYYTSGGSSSVHIGRNSGAGITTGAFNTHIGMSDAVSIPSNTDATLHLIAGGGYEANNAASVLSGLTTKYAMIGGGYDYSRYINDFYLGAGPFVLLPNLANLNLYAPSGNGTDLVGSNFIINAGRGTGTGTPGDFIIKTSTATTTGTTVQTLTERLRVAGTNGDITASSLAGSGTRMVTADSTGKLSTQTIPAGTVTGVTATSPITSSGGNTPTISTSMATNKLIGRSTAGTGVMEEITVGSGLSLSGGTLNATATSVGFEMNFLLMGA